MGKRFKARKSQRNGFTLTEVIVSTALLMVGAVGVAQLVPMSVNLNTGNRNNSMSLILAQRFLNEMLDQPVTTTFCTAGLTSPSCPDAVSNVNGSATAVTWNLGDPGQPGALVGSPVVTRTTALQNVNWQNTTLVSAPAIDFTASPIPGYSFTFTDPADPLQLKYDVRWAVVTTLNPVGEPFSKRIILGVQQEGGSSLTQPVTLDTMVTR